MKKCTRYLMMAVLLWVAAASSRAQEERSAPTARPAPRADDRAAGSDGASTSAAALNDNWATPMGRQPSRAALQMRLDVLRKYRLMSAGSMRPGEAAAVEAAILEVETGLRELGAASDASPRSAAPAPRQGGTCNPTADTDFCLGAPEDRATDVSLQPTLAWTEPRRKVADPDAVREYVVRVSENSTLNPAVITESVPGDGDEEYSVPEKQKLRPNTTYYWTVRAIFKDGTEVDAMNGAYRFTTTLNLFAALSEKGLRLRKALTGPDAGELAEFSFLNTIGEKTVFSTTFALSWQSNRVAEFGNTSVQLGTSVEGSLASDESESEDAWRFRGKAILTTNFIRCSVGTSPTSPCPPSSLTRPTFESLITYISAKLEGDKDFDVRKVSAEFMFTPNSRKLAIGTARPELPKHPVQFQWRPFFRIDAGHTMRRGVSEEAEDTIFRLVPRVRARLDLHFLRQALNMNNVAVFADDTFYYLPLENVRKRNNFFMSGIEFNFTPNLGFGLTYKNGRSAPKFEKINTLQGVIGVRF